MCKTHFLVFTTGPGIHRAMGMILTGREVSAVEGERLGFVTEVVAHDRLAARALELANAVLECSPDSIRASKVGSARLAGTT